MNPDVIYAKTEKGLEEMTKRTFKLPARMRTLLIMIDGKAPIADLISKSASPDEAAAYFAALLDDGFIAPKGIGPSQAARPATPPAGADALNAAKRYVIHALEHALGPDADLFTAKVEAAASVGDLAQLAPKHAEVIRGIGGAKKVEVFVHGLLDNRILTAEAAATLLPAAATASRAPTAPATVAPIPSVAPTPSAAAASIATTARSATTSTAPVPDKGFALDEAKRTIVQFLREALGPDADQFTAKVEAITSAAELRAVAQKYGDVIKVASGSRKAEEFHRRVSSSLS